MYTSPTFGGARLLASWGEDDTWDVAIWWTKEWNSVRFVGGVGYLNDQDETHTPGVAQFEEDGDRDNEEWKGSASIQHVPSGLFVTGAFVTREYNGTENQNPNTLQQRADFDWWYLQAGIRKRWNSLGQTSLYGEYSEGDDGLTNTVANVANVNFLNVTSSNLEMWGLGVGQDIDNAAMNLFAAYRHYEFELSGQTAVGGAITAIPLEDFDVFYVGGRIRF